MTNTLDMLLFAFLPYLVIIMFLYVTIQRYRSKAFTYSSLSSQFLENDKHFSALVPFHYGILAVFVLHLACFFVPKTILFWNQTPLRAFLLEATGLTFGFVTLVGLFNIIQRRLTEKRLAPVTTPMDWAVYTLLFTQVVSGVLIAIFHRWGTSWFSAVLTPYIWSVFTLNPDVSGISSMPFLVKWHILNAMGIFMLFPFTRLVHVLVVPNQYLIRKPQVVRWSHQKLLKRL